MYREKRYWVLAILAEAQIGLQEEALASNACGKPSPAAPEEWMKESTQEQVTKLKSAPGGVSAKGSFPPLGTL